MSATQDRTDPPNLHASTVAFGRDAGIVIRGPSGAGKSRLALSLIDAGAQLVADDQTLLARSGDAVFARPPRPIEGLIEVRGLGLVRLPFLRLARVRLVVDLGADRPARLPSAESCILAEVALPRLHACVEGPSPSAIGHYIKALIRAG